jgi:hypothetical protein
MSDLYLQSPMHQYFKNFAGIDLVSPSSLASLPQLLCKGN